MASDVSFSWRRSVAWALSIAVHLALVVALTLPHPLIPSAPRADDPVAPAGVPVDLPNPSRGASAEAAMEVPRDHATASDVPRASSPAPDRSAADAPAPRPPPRPEGGGADRVPLPLVIENPSPVARGTPFLDDEARALLPHEPMYAAAPAPREGSFHTPGDGREDDVFYRPRALDPNPSRFAHAWKPSGNLIDGWLGALVEKATGRVSIPLNSKFNLVCTTVAGVAGDCRIVRNAGTGVIVQRPPPAPWERSHRVQCRELREAFDAAEDAAELAYYLDRLSALCSDTAENDEARRKAGLPEEGRASSDAATGPQRAR